MFIQCPQCRTHNTISEDLLRDQEEVIRCRHCQLEFTLSLTPRTPARGENTASLREEAPFKINLSPEALDRLAIQEQQTQTNKTTAKRPRARGTWAWTLANLLLILGFFVQYSYFMRAPLSRHPEFRPWLEKLCHYAHCRVPLLRDLKRIQIIARNISPHPTVAGALTVSVTLLNTAPFTQPFPGLALSFYDINHRPLAQRQFKPAQYLPTGIKVDQGLPPQTPLAIKLELVDPGRQAVNYEFGLY